jgi:hypothetical protein
MDMGMPFVGRATLGYEPLNDRWVSTWIDSMSPYHYFLSGQLEGDVLCMEGEGYNCQIGAVCRHRSTEERIGEDERVFEMFVTLPGGNEVKLMTHRYTRA